MQELIRVCVMVELKYISLLRAENECSLVAFIAGKTAAGRYDQFVFTLNQPIKFSTRYFAVCFSKKRLVKAGRTSLSKTLYALLFFISLKALGFS